jgi:hypothetical protein
LGYIKYHCNNYKLNKENELTRNVRFRSMQWVGHMVGMKDERVHKKALTGYTRGRPRGRWLDTVGRDAKRMLKRRIWRMSAEDRDAWSRRIEETKAQVGL